MCSKFNCTQRSSLNFLIIRYYVNIIFLRMLVVSSVTSVKEAKPSIIDTFDYVFRFLILLSCINKINVFEKQRFYLILIKLETTLCLVKEKNIFLHRPKKFKEGTWTLSTPDMARTKMIHKIHCRSKVRILQFELRNGDHISMDLYNCMNHVN